MGFLDGEEGIYNFGPERFIDHLIEHVERGEMSLHAALEAATMLNTGRSIDVTREWQVALIALGHEEIGFHFMSVAITMSRAGLGMALGQNRDSDLNLNTLDDDQRRAMDVAAMAVLRRAGIDAHFHDDGELHISKPEGGEDDNEIITQFMRDLDRLPTQDPHHDKRGWGKWTK